MMKRTLGSVFTPLSIARSLTDWSITTKHDVVLDMGVGEGAFVFSAYNRLLALGNSSEEAVGKIYGSEIHNDTFNKFKLLASGKNIFLPNVYLRDFFDCEFPLVDAVIGNPPYVRSRYIKNLSHIRKKVLDNHADLDENQLYGLSDLYLYFLLQAITRLKNNGRLATIIPDSWLNVRYGIPLKKYLLTNFKEINIISLDKTVFLDAQVKPIFLLGIKKSSERDITTLRFSKIKGNFDVVNLTKVFEERNIKGVDFSKTELTEETISPEDKWGNFLKDHHVYQYLSNHKRMVPLKNLGKTQIGIQTLAKEFFVLSTQYVNTMGIEEKFLRPFLYSASDVDTLEIDEKTLINSCIFYCSDSKDDLCGTKALAYIVKGEEKEIIFRTKGDIKSVKGYHSKDRIIRSNRKYWYDLRSSIERKGTSPILIPRLIYKKFHVIWNKIGLIAGEGNVEFEPHDKKADIRVFLAMLNSSIGEYLVRMSSQMYGGGAYTVGLNTIKNMPMIDINSLSFEEKELLIEAYQKFLISANRELIDITICRILNIDEPTNKTIIEALDNLHISAVSAKENK